MANRTRKEEWIAVGVVIGFIALGSLFFLARNLLTYRGLGAGGNAARVSTESVPPPAEDRELGPTTVEEESMEVNTEEDSVEMEEPEEDWRGKLAEEMGLSQEQREILEMIDSSDEGESSQAVELRRRTLQEFFTEEQRKKIEDRLKRFSLDGYREELRERVTAQPNDSP